MRRLIIVVLAAVSALTLISFAALAAGAQTASQQYATEDPAQEESTTPQQSSDAAPAENASADGSSSGGSPSQGSATKGRAGPNEPSLVDDTPPTAAELREPLVSTDGRASSNASGHDVVRAAKRYIGTRYGFGACSGKRMSCTCLTKKVFAKFGHRLPMSEAGQWQYNRGRKVARSNLQPGDIVFFKEKGRKRGITHLGIYSGGGELVHASKFFRGVVESEMRYIKGYSGAKRLNPR